MEYLLRNFQALAQGIMSKEISQSLTLENGLVEASKQAKGGLLYYEMITNLVQQLLKSQVPSLGMLQFFTLDMKKILTT